MVQNSQPYIITNNSIPYLINVNLIGCHIRVLLTDLPNYRRYEPA